MLILKLKKKKNKFLWLCSNFPVFCLIRIHLFYLFSAKKFDFAQKLQTHPELLDRAYNRPTLETLKKVDFADYIDDEKLKVCKFAS